MSAETRFGTYIDPPIDWDKGDDLCSICDGGPREY